MIKTKTESPEVLYYNQNELLVNKKILDYLKQKSKKNKKKIIRLCVHKSKKDKIHEMFIIFPRNYFCFPHKHPNEESILVIKGYADIIIFKNNGDIKNIINLGDFSTNKIFFYKFRKNTIHLLIVKSKYFYFKEVTKGPFKKKNMSKPLWCPTENKKEISKFLKILKKKISEYKQ